jgi:hypothetical protein
MEVTEEWKRYGQAVVNSMHDLLEEVPESARPHLLETADYWLSLGLTMGLEQPNEAERLLELIEGQEPEERSQLAQDATNLYGEVFG